MKQKAKLKDLNKNIEEEVIIEVEKIQFVGFSNTLPYQLTIGMEYDVLLGITILDEFHISEIESQIKQLIPFNNSFGYTIRGVLRKGGFIDAGIVFQDEVLEEFEYLFNKYVEIKVDRISVEFV